MVNELKELSDRAQKLHEFVSGQKFNTLPEDKQRMMQTQLTAMRQYEMALAERLRMEGIDPMGEIEPSFGMKLVGHSFNPSGDPAVTRAKALAAELADMAHEHQAPNDYLGSTFKGGAIRHILSGQMWLVKLLTYKA